MKQKILFLILTLFISLNSWAQTTTFTFTAKADGVDAVKTRFTNGYNADPDLNRFPGATGEPTFPDPEGGVYKVVFPGTVTSIGDFAFFECGALTSITIPNSVTSLGFVALGSCTGLTSITIPASVTSIGGGTFYLCDGLASVTFEEGIQLETIGESAFQHCDLTSIEIPATVKTIGANPFIDCAKLTSQSLTVAQGNTSFSMTGNALVENSTKRLITGFADTQIPDDIIIIGESSFSNYSSLTSVNIPNTVTSIRECAFFGCSSLVSVTIPEDVTSIGNKAFFDCEDLASVVCLATNVPDLGDDAFDCCAENLAIYVPKGDKENDYVNATNWSNYYERIKGFDGTCGDAVVWTYDYGSRILTIAGTGAMADYEFREAKRPWFYSRSNITSVVIEKGVTSIGGYAFSGCSNLASATIPNSVTHIGKYAFNGCHENLFNTEDYVTYVGDYLVGVSDKNKSSYPIKEGTRLIVEPAFKDCKSLTSITIPASVESIGSNAFSFCSSLESVTFEHGSKLTNIGSLVFDWSGLTSITIPASVTNIEAGVFGRCPSLASIVVDDENATFDSRNECNAIIKKEGNVLVAGCQNTIIPNSVTSIGNSAFHRCSSLTTIDIPTSVTSIGEFAFIQCSNLASVTIPNSVTHIGICAFDECSNELYTNIDDVTYIDDCLIGGYNYKQSSCSIKEGTRLIADKAFARCSYLTSITIPASVTNIGEKAFEGCSNLVSVTCLATSVPDLGDYVFAYVDENNDPHYRDDVSIYVPAESVGDYTNSTPGVSKGWYNYSEMIKAIPVPVTLTSATGFATFSSQYALDFTDLDVKAYKATVDNANGKIKFARVNRVPAGTGLFLAGTTSADYDIPVYAGNVFDDLSDNDLVPTTGGALSIGDYVYVISAGTFQELQSTPVVSKGKAYIPTAKVTWTGGGSAKDLMIEFSEATSVASLSTVNGQQSTAVFNLAGQIVDKNYKGIVIVNGKKMLNK